MPLRCLQPSLFECEDQDLPPQSSLFHAKLVSLPVNRDDQQNQEGRHHLVHKYAHTPVDTLPLVFVWFLDPPKCKLCAKTKKYL